MAARDACRWMVLCQFAFAFAGCKAQIPDGVFACKTDRDCPAGMFCHTNVERCFARSAASPAKSHDGGGVTSGSIIGDGDAGSSRANAASEAGVINSEGGAREAGTTAGGGGTNEAGVGGEGVAGSGGASGSGTSGAGGASASGGTSGTGQGGSGGSVAFEPCQRADQEGQPCEDGKFCTTGETCQSGKCQGGTTTSCPSPDGCNIGVCNPDSDRCEPMPTDGKACDDGMFCTTGEQCQGGACTGGAATDCSSAADQCNAGSCDESTKACVKTPLPGTPGCDDANACTINDACSAGQCAGTPVNCDDGDDCTIDSCTKSTGTCKHTPLSCGTGKICCPGSGCVPLTGCQ